MEHWFDQIHGEIARQRKKQHTLAEELDVSLNTLRRYLRNPGKMPVSKFINLCQVLDLDINQVKYLGRKSEKNA